ncbi:MAG: phenylacetate--CoA ligase family protein [Burkholderiales bacterium]|nr:phenylacetate--CoA ligase family protein [Burkholderiales bacterium]
MSPADSLQVAFDQWTVGALVTNLLWTRCLGVAAIAAAREQRLAERLAQARMHSPYYRRAWHTLPAGPLALTDLPVVTKAQLMTAFDDWCTDRAIAWRDVEAFIAARAHIGERFRGRYAVWTSSGTTGAPGVFVQDPGALAVYDALVSVQLVGPALGDWSAAARRGRAALVTADSDHFAGIAFWRRQAQRKPWLDMRTFPVAAPLATIVAGLNDYDPAFLASYPTMLTLLAGEQGAGRLRLSLTGMWCGGETLSAAARIAIEDTFGCPLANEYGASECLSIGYACRHGAMHVNADWVVLEPVDRDYRPTPPGELSHTVLLTNLANAVQPIIRYDLGDRVRMRATPCPCGNALPALEIEGRTDDILSLTAGDGTRVKLVPLAIATVVEDAARIYRFQIVQSAPDALCLRLSHADRVRNPAALRALRAYLDAQGLANVTVRLDEAEPGEARDGKLRQVVALRGY